MIYGMPTQSELVGRIWADIVAQERSPSPPWKAEKGLPNIIASESGKSLFISSQTAKDINAFAHIFHNSSPALKIAYGSKDVSDLVRRAFGSVLAQTDTDTPAEAACANILKGVQQYLHELISQPKPPMTYVFGCWLIRDEVVTEIRFGPVCYERRHLWLNRMRADGHVSELISRRVRRHWEGKKLRPLKNHEDRWREKGLIEAIGKCPMVCTVEAKGMSADVGYDKAVLAAKLGMTAVSLLWERPSRALEGFGLLIDGSSLLQHYVVFGETGAMTYAQNRGHPVGSTWIIPEEWPDIWNDNAWLIAPVTEFLTSLLDPCSPASRPKVARTLLFAMWWLYEACRAEAPLMAAAKFGACLDTLAGGQSEDRIMRLLEGRLGSRADDPVTPDGRTTRAVIKAIYGAARSQTLHGSNERYDHDWRGTRDLAEHLIRMVFVEVLDWLADHPDAPDLSGAIAERAAPNASRQSVSPPHSGQK